MKARSSKPKRIWLFALSYYLCVAVSAAAISGVLQSYLPDDSGAISLLTVHGAEENSVYQTTDVAAEQTMPSSQAFSGSEAASQPLKPSFEASDDQTVWSTNTQVEIFRVSYVNGEHIVTVNSDNGEKIIAPGTENTYTFKLKNTGNCPLDYTVAVSAGFSPEHITIPIESKLNRYDGKWIVGGKNAYASVSALDAAADAATLGAGKYTYYTLEWIWPFESGNDTLDTTLGNLATDEDLIFSVVIETTAMQNTNSSADNGIVPPPHMGDHAFVALWSWMAVGSLLLMVVMLFFPIGEKRQKEVEEEKS